MHTLSLFCELSLILALGLILALFLILVPGAPYFIPAGRAAAAATTLLPTLVIVVLVTARHIDLEDSVTMSGRLRTALIAHAAYFSVLPLMFESGLDFTGAVLDALRPGLSPGAIPATPDNLFWMMTLLAGELFFVATVAYLVMASLHAVPRWALLVPLAQVAYNIKNSLVWLVLFPYFSPTRTPNLFMLADFLFIFPCALVYLAAYLGKATHRGRAELR